MRKRFRSGRIAGIVLALALLVVGIFLYESAYEYENRIFAEFEELDFLNAYAVSCEEDPNIEDLVYENGFCGSVLFEDTKFLVCAYEFDGAESAKRYYANVWGEEFSQWKDWWVRSRSSAARAEYMAFYENRVLYFRADTPRHNAVKFENWLAEHLSVKLPDSPALEAGEAEKIAGTYETDIQKQAPSWVEDVIDALGTPPPSQEGFTE